MTQQHVKVLVVHASVTLAHAVKILALARQHVTQQYVTQ